VPPDRASDVLIYTVAWGKREFLLHSLRPLRAAMGLWADWAVWLGAPAPPVQDGFRKLLQRDDSGGIQYLTTWPENRGQHHATTEALTLAREKGYKWLLRLDDDVAPKTLRFLKKMLGHTQALRKLAGDDRDRIISSPRIVGLQNPLTPVAEIAKGQKFIAEVMSILGGACRLHPVEFLRDYVPPLYAPKGRMDPQSIARYTEEHDGLLVRFPGVRVKHNTKEIERADDKKHAHVRKMGYSWPFLEWDDGA